MFKEIQVIEAGNGVKTSLMEANEKAHRELQAKTTKVIENYATSLGIKDWKKVLDFGRADFSIKKFREGAYALSAKLRESQSELMWGQLLRAGVQNTFNDIYQAVPVTYKAALREVSSNKRQEFYSPVERVGFPTRTMRGDSFKETNFKGLDIELVNYKSGMILAFERELIDDDQTGQIQQRAGQMGENAALYEEAYVWNRMFAGALSLEGEPLPASVTYGTPYVTGTPGSSGGIHSNGNGVNATTAARLSQAGIQAGWILAQKMLDQSGRPMMVMPKLLATSPQDIFLAKILLNSQVNPSSSSTQTADIGKTGSIGSVNPIAGLTAVVTSRFIPDYGALMIDSGKGFAFQRRDPTEVVQENPMSGPAFSQEVFRYKERARWEADFIDPKFMINLNTSFSAT